MKVPICNTVPNTMTQESTHDGGKVATALDGITNTDSSLLLERKPLSEIGISSPQGAQADVCSMRTALDTNFPFPSQRVNKSFEEDNAAAALHELSMCNDYMEVVGNKLSSAYLAKSRLVMPYVEGIEPTKHEVKAAVKSLKSASNDEVAIAPPENSQTDLLAIDSALLKRSRVIDVLSSSNEALLMELPDGRRVVQKDFGSMLAFDDDGVRDQKARAHNEVLAYQFSEVLGLGIVPKTELVEGTNNKVVSTYIENGGAEEKFNRKETSLYAFDFLLNVRDRLDTGGNIIHGDDGKVYAIDHETILEPGAEWIKRGGVNKDHIDLLLPSDEAKQKFIREDWGDFLDKNLKYWNSDDAVQAKNNFMDRVGYVQDQLSARIDILRV
ncbi:MULTISPECIES: hypothetical protein [unclassified Pseudomonas]|uniref:hypothetical protein n=1 Tax=unclassified Pseudomonas TaxID=196821 RepID=UPI00117A2108|nr:MULTISPECIES: hypothetical protein [unclassified Pseudomonas]